MDASLDIDAQTSTDSATTPGVVRIAAARVAPAPQTSGTSPVTPRAQGEDYAALRDVLHAASLPSAAHALAARVATLYGCDRVTVGLRRDDRTDLLASSAIDVVNAAADVRQRLTAAMDEAIEQAITVQWPPGSASERMRADTATIALAHRELMRSSGAAVATVPLGHDGQVFGAVCVERDRHFDERELLDLEALLSLCLPALRWIDQARQPMLRRARVWLAETAHSLRQPQRGRARAVLAAASACLVVAAVVPMGHDVSGRARIEGLEQRVLAAPTDGFVKTAHVRPGDTVRQGQPLVDLLDADLRLEQERWRSQLVQYENDYAAAMAKSDRGLAATSLARSNEATAQLQLVEQQLLRGRLTAPFDGIVVDGDLAQSIGAPVRQGDRLVTLARSDRHRVIVEIDETDIARVTAGQQGTLAVSALSWSRQPLVVERVMPLAKAVDGRNVFEVEARLTEPTASLRPGLLGHADLRVGERPLLWAWAQRAMDRVRLTWWSWLG
jgi:Barrel-sandwich domain of CusB or HlyD membrane-fusion/GAF domain